MSRAIWTRCAGSSELRRLACAASRAVESQHLVSTRRLVDSAEEQALLEELVDRVKPAPPFCAGFDGLHYLLWTPFRHPPLRHGSRFGTRAERGIWYGSRELRPCFAEVAYYRFLFLEGTAAVLTPLTIELTVFQADIRTRRGIDLTRAPFSAYAAALTSKSSYAATQELGAAMREARVAAFFYTSARDPQKGTNVGLFEPAFTRKTPRQTSVWVCTVDRDKAELVEKAFTPGRRAHHTFSRADFEVAGRLPSPAT
jgi:hypothetical protein